MGGGGRINSQAKYKAFSWAMQGVEFTLGGCDVELGMQWIKEIRPIMLDATKLSTSFKRDGKWVTLYGIKEKGRLSSLAGKNVAVQLMRAHDRAEPMVQLYSIQMEEKVKEVSEANQPILDSYNDVFWEPTFLPPNRTQDHHIPLNPNSQPINVRNYRQPHIQKKTR